MFIDAISLLFGDGMLAVPLHRVGERFETAYLQNKLLNICGDIDTKYISDTGVIKTIIGGDKLRAEFKGGKSFNFKPVCRFIFSANSLPPVADKSHGWYSRWKYIKFPRTFDVNPTYKIQHDKLFEQEKSGILNWALEGLKRLKKKNEWTLSEDMKKSEIEYRSENDNVAAFLDDYIDRCQYGGSTKELIPTKTLHICYKEWMDNYMLGSRPVSLKEFSKRVRTYGFDKAVRTVNGKSTNVFMGMRPKMQYLEDYKTCEMMI